MSTKNNIGELLEKFKKGALSPQEARELASLAQTGDEDRALKQALINCWQELGNYEPNIPTDKMLNTLKEGWHKSQEKQTLSFTPSHASAWQPILRYAAIIIFSVGITWLVKDFFANRQNNSFIDKGTENSNEIVVSYGSKSKVTLPDGSVVNLNSGTTLRYPARFDRFTRNVYIEGEAFFDVKKDAKHPFYVKTKDITIKVLGTRFNVKSYPDERTIQTTLITGVIELYSNQKEMTDKTRLLVLKPNQQATFEKTREEMSVSDQKISSEQRDLESSTSSLVYSQVDVAPVIAWKDNRLAFRDEKFTDLSRKLERWYDVEIEITDKELATALFSGVFVKETIEQALNALKLATPFRYQMKKNHIIISKY